MWDFEKKEYGGSKHLKIMMRLKYQNNPQGSGIYPQKPGIFLAGPLDVKSGVTYKLS